MKMRSLSIRRWGVAALTGVTLLGGLSILGEGVASAATTASAVLASGASVASLPGNTGGTGGGLTVSVNGTIKVGDEVIITAGCPKAGTTQFTGSMAGTTSATTLTDSGGTVWDSTHASSGACGASINNELVLTAVTPLGAVGSGPVNPTMTFSPIYALATKSSGSNKGSETTGPIALSGTYAPVSSTASTFTVPTDASVIWFGLTTNTPPSVLAQSAASKPVSSVQISEPANLSLVPTGSAICVVLQAAGGGNGSTFIANTSLAASAVGTGYTITAASTSVVNTTTVQFGVTATTPANGVDFTLSGLEVSTGAAAAGAGTATVFVDPTGPSDNCATVTPLFGTPTLFTVLTTTQTYGPDGTADGTVAQEFEAAYPVANGGNKTVVLATDVDPYDALSASYLEGELGTGLLITPPTTLGTDAANAMRLEGVTTVYVLGGPKAIAPSVVAALAATPAYNNGGLTLTGNPITVIGGATSATQASGPLFGANQDATAQASDTYFGSAPVGSISVNGAYTSSGIGAFNDTTGTGSTSGSGGATGILISDSDFQDAMSIAPEAFAFKLPVILTEQATTGTSTLGAEATAAINSLGIKQLIALGGQLALPSAVTTAAAALNGGISVLRIAGIDGTDTAGQIANFALDSTGTGLNWGVTSTSFLVSHGDYWSDALGAAAIGSGTAANSVFGATPEPILLTENPTTVGTYTTAVLNTAGGSSGIQSDTLIGTLNILGGPLAMPTATISALVTALST